MDIHKAILDQVATEQEHQDLDGSLTALGLTPADFADLVTVAKRYAAPADPYGDGFLKGLKQGLAIGIRAAKT